MASGLDAHTTVINNTEAYDMRVRLEKAVPRHRHCHHKRPERRSRRRATATRTPQQRDGLYQRQR